MSRCKSRGKRHRIPLARSQSFRSEMDLIDDSHSGRASFLNRSSSPTPNAKSSCDDGESGALSDTDANGVSTNGLKEIRIRNGFSLTPFPPSENEKSDRSKMAILGPPMNKLAGSISTLNTTCTDGRSNRLQKSPSTSSQQSENPTELTSSTKIKLDGVNLPSFEESIVDGFSVMAFKDQSDLEPSSVFCICVFVRSYCGSQLGDTHAPFLRPSPLSPPPTLSRQTDRRAANCCYLTNVSSSSPLNGSYSSICALEITFASTTHRQLCLKGVDVKIGTSGCELKHPYPLFLISTHTSSLIHYPAPLSPFLSDGGGGGGGGVYTGDELYARLTEKVAEEVPSRRTGSRVASSGSLHHSGRQRRGCVANNTVGMSRTPGRGRRSAGPNSTSDHVSSNGIDAESTECRTSNDTGGSRESPRLGPLHIEVSSPTVNAVAATRKRLCPSRAVEAEENCQRFSNGGLGSLSSSDNKTFPVLSLKSGASNNSSANIASTSTPKRNLFSIEALTAVEKKEHSVETEDVPDACSYSQQQQQQQQQQQMHPPPVPQISAHQNGHLLTSVQWLERLKKCVGPKGFLVPIHEAEIRQLAHLLTDRDFKEEVARIPYVSQVLSNLCAHQQQRCQRIPTTQSFVNSFNAQQNSAGSNRAFPPPQLANQGGSDNTLNPTGTAHHYPPPNFFSSAAAVAAAIAAAASSTSAGIRPPSLHLGPGQPVLPGQFLPGTSGSQLQPPSSHSHQPIPPRHSHPALSQPRQQYHTAMTGNGPPLSSPHMPISFWNAQQQHPQQTHPNEFAYLMSPNLNVAAPMRKASALDAVDLTSPSSGGNNSLKQLTSRKTPLPSPIPPLPLPSTPHFGFPNFWPNQRPLPHAAIPPPPARHFLPRFADLFHFNGSVGSSHFSHFY
ncbi:hypothetical protein Aperf_G00000019706 [Anoplocephala perfoliata]